jgi:uncharacterized protein (TIGR03000 family)
MMFALAILSAASTAGIAAAQMPWSQQGQYYYRERGFSGGGYRFSPPATTTESQAFYPSLPEPVSVHVSVPDGARLAFNGAETRQRGSSRWFVSPPIATGGTYSYVIQATWNEKGREVTRTRRLSVRAGDMWNVTIGRDGVTVDREN